jgi:hypothetical protein
MTTTLRLLTLALLTSSTFVLTDCRKTNESDAPALTERERFLTTPNWYFDSATEVRTTPAGVVTTTPNFTAGFDPCSLDDLTHYRSDRTFTIVEGPQSCPTRQSTTGTWDFASNETELLVADTGQPGTAHHQIQALTATSFSYTFFQNTLYDGTQVDLIVNFTAR